MRMRFVCFDSHMIQPVCSMPVRLDWVCMPPSMLIPPFCSMRIYFMPFSWMRFACLRMCAACGILLLAHEGGMLAHVCACLRMWAACLRMCVQACACGRHACACVHACASGRHVGGMLAHVCACLPCLRICVVNSVCSMLPHVCSLPAAHLHRDSLSHHLDLHT